MIGELVCILCPNGCTLRVAMGKEKLNVEGALCRRGREYARRELTEPMRTISTSVPVIGGECPLAPVRLDGPIPKARIFDFMKQINSVRLKAPVYIGQIVLPNVCGTQSNAIVTKNVK